MSTDSKPVSPNNLLETSNKENDDQQLTPEKSIERKSTSLSSSKSLLAEKQDDHQSVSDKLTRFASESPNETNIDINDRPTSPKNHHRTVKQDKSTLKNHRRTRSNSPQKNFSYLTFDTLNLRKWKEQRQQFAKQEEYNRIYHENRQKLQRLAHIAREPSSYPATYIEHDRLRARHVAEYRRKVLKDYIPIMRENLSLVHRLANVKGAYDIKKMDEDFIRHTSIIEQQAAYKKKIREIEKQRPFILPKVHLKS